MEYIFTVMFKNEPVANVRITGERSDVTIERLTSCVWKTPFPNKDINTISYVYSFLKSRCYDNNRADLQEILALHGLKDNNPYDWCKKTHGVTYNDFWWLLFPGESLKWEDVKVR